MKRLAKPSWFPRTFSRTLALIAAVSFLAILPQAARAQRSTASINGTVRDSTGAVIPQATVVLTNTATNVAQTATTNDTGDYVVLNILPGRYLLRASKEGFETVTQPDITLEVNQTTTFDFTLPVGSARQTVTVEAAASHIESSTAELGTAITKTEVNDLPLNGRNFTELLSLTPGVSPISVSQNSGGGGGFVGNPIGSFTFPSVNGQNNRSNFFLLDGLNDQGSFISTYGVAPIVDDVQEFKVQSHNDSSEFGGSLGGIVNVVTKSGTNELHGSVWEFLRNNALDARNPFFSAVTPFKQNQFGGTAGGPVILPHFNGRNKTFFFASYEGFRNHSAAEGLFRTPTPAELSGDLSDLPEQIYNPFSTRPDPSRPGQFIRDPFRNNQIPANLLNPGMLTYAKALFPAPVATNVPNINGIDNTPVITRQDTAGLRFDQQIGQRSSLWVRYTGFTQPDSRSGGFPGILSRVFLHGYNAAVSYTHIFSGSAVASFQFGRNSVQDNVIIDTIKAPPTLWQQAGFSPNFAGGFASGNGPFNPGIGIPGFLSFATGNHVQDTHLADIYEFKGDFSKISGRHTFKMGADFSTNNTHSPIFGVSDSFSASQTDNPENPTNTGNPLASFLLGVPDSSGRRNVNETEHGGWIDGFYFQDQWKATGRLTVNLGIRYDVTLNPIYGSLQDKNQMVGDLNLNDGTYVLARMAPPCGNGVGAPCIPGGVLPAHVVLTPLSNHAIIHNVYDNWQPRIGLAYRLKERTVLRASYGRFFDNWASIIQIAQNYEGTWPSIGQLLAQNLNTPEPGLPTPTATAQDPFGLGAAPPLPAPTPFLSSGFVQWYMSPTIKNPYSDQWNLGVQQQLSASTVLTANYVGSHSSRLDVGGFNNVALTPGPGKPQDRAPYPYIPATFYDHSVGRSSYNAFQFSLNRTSSRGVAYLISYTWSKSMSLACDGWFGVEGCSVQNPYDYNAEKSVSGFDLTHVFSLSTVYELPFGSGKKLSSGNPRLDYVIGNWQLNGILTLTSGTPYNVTTNSHISNTGNVTERPDLIGNPNPSNRSVSHWLNPAAFANCNSTSVFGAQAPTFCFGNLGRNALRSDRFKNLDFSLFRRFPLTENKSLEFRAEAFNFTNTPVWGQPDSNIQDQNFGEITRTANHARQFQFALKFYF